MIVLRHSLTGSSNRSKTCRQRSKMTQDQPKHKFLSQASKLTYRNQLAKDQINPLETPKTTRFPTKEQLQPRLLPLPGLSKLCTKGRKIFPYPKISLKAQLTKFSSQTAALINLWTKIINRWTQNKLSMRSLIASEEARTKQPPVILSEVSKMD